MGDFYVWTAAELGLDIEEMDHEHQDLIAKMNALYKGVEEKKVVSELQKLIDDLAAYTVKHFSDEEAYMEKVKFPGLDTHKIIHKQLLTQFGEHVDNFKKTGEIPQAFFNFLKVWLTGHIRGIDMKYSHFKKTGKAA